jgi:hypothetical protein
MAADAADADDTGLLPLCFVLMPFGSKDDPAGGKVHFDAVYDEIIRPAVEDAGMKCVRADEERVGGIIHKPMYERLLLCDYAVADLSIANANVFYELGIRHATRPRSTVLVFHEGLRLPFDVAPLRGMPYRLDDAGRPHPDHRAADREALTAKLRDARRSHTPDSPLFQLLTDLTAPDTSTLGSDLFRERLRATEAVQRRLHSARDEGDLTRMRAVRAELGDLDDAETGLMIELLRSYIAVKAYDDAIALIVDMPEIVARVPYVRERHAFVLNRLGRRREAEAVLRRLLAERGADSETYGLLGRVYKDHWLAVVDHGPPEVAGPLLDRAIDAYRTGFAADWRDHYPGINAVQLMHLRNPADPEIAALLPVVRYGAQQKALRHQADYWDYATLVEVAVLENNQYAAWEAVGYATIAAPEKWQVETTVETLVRLREAREREDPVPDWLRKIEAALLRIVTDPR